MEGRKRTNSSKRKDKSSETKRYKPDEVNEKINSNKNKKTSNKKVKKNKKQSKAKKIIKRILIAFLIIGVLLGLIVAGIIAGIFFGLFDDDFKMTKEDLIISFSNSEVYDADGNLIATLSGNEKRKIVSMSEMAEYLPKAYVAIEDERFYQHSGVDIKRTGAATITYLLHRGDSSFGGSTITQQLVKNITKDDEDTALRKVKEMAKAIQIEKEISKDNILELYLNIIFVGGNNINGVALGAEYYFDKDVKDLSLAECAYMAGINNSPNAYNPFGKNSQANIKKGEERTKTVLKKMLELKYISKEEYDNAIKEVDAGLKFKQGNLSSGTIYSYHTEAAIEQIINQLMEEKGMSRAMAETKIYGGGLKIYTTQKTDYQTIMEDEMKRDYYVKNTTPQDKNNPHHPQAAMVVIDHTNGQVVACVGELGEKTTNGNLNRVTKIYKQTGSSMKPISVISPAVNEGVITAASVYEDKPININGYQPKNYYKGYKGKSTVRGAIEISGNTIPVQILDQLGVPKSVEYIKKMGITTVTGDEGLSLALGGLTTGVSPLQMAGAYATIANDGVYIEPTFYTKVIDSNGEVLLESNQEKREVLDPSNAYIVKSILTQPVVGSAGTAKYCKISGMDTCAKTGTTNDDFDRWLCGFTPYYTAVTWYGYDKNEEVNYHGSPSNPAGGIWSAVMKGIHADLENKSFTVPSNIVKVSVCKNTGMLPGEGCPAYTEVFVKGTEPTETCTDVTATKYSICAESGLLAIPGVCPNILETTFSNNPEEIPTETCNIHKKEEKPENNQNPTENNPTEPEKKPTTEQKPNTGTTNPGTTTDPGNTTDPGKDPDTNTNTNTNSNPDTNTNTNTGGGTDPGGGSGGNENTNTTN